MEKERRNIKQAALELAEEEESLRYRAENKNWLRTWSIRKTCIQVYLYYIPLQYLSGVLKFVIHLLIYKAIHGPCT
jgi:hypothetical protein